MHRNVVAVDEADVVEIEATTAVEGELSESGGWGGAGAVAFDKARAAVGSGAGEVAGGIGGAESAGPNAAGPGGGEREERSSAGEEGETGGGERGGSGAG